MIDRVHLTGRIDLIAGGDAEQGVRLLAARSPYPDLHPDANLPDDTRLWAALKCGW